MKVYKYLSAKYALEYLRTKMLKVATLEDVNDPNEWIPYLQNETDGSDYLADPKLRVAFKNQWGHKFGFISFSTQMDNSILWAHYGDKFKGIVLEFEIGPSASVFPVRYQSTRYLINKAELGKVSDCDQLQQFIAQKDSVWAHESEWRILIGLADCQIHVTESGDPIYLAGMGKGICLSGVVLGPECPVRLGHILCELESVKNDEICIRRMCWDSSTYSLYVSDECKINQPQLWNMRTDLHTTMRRQPIPITGNE